MHKVLPDFSTPQWSKTGDLYAVNSNAVNKSSLRDVGMFENWGEGTSSDVVGIICRDVGMSENLGKGGGGKY
jgi:hypothetical protein